MNTVHDVGEDLADDLAFAIADAETQVKRWDEALCEATRELDLWSSYLDRMREELRRATCAIPRKPAADRARPETGSENASDSE